MPEFHGYDLAFREPAMLSMPFPPFLLCPPCIPRRLLRSRVKSCLVKVTVVPLRFYYRSRVLDVDSNFANSVRGQFPHIVWMLLNFGSAISESCSRVNAVQLVF